MSPNQLFNSAYDLSSWIIVSAPLIGLIIFFAVIGFTKIFKKKFGSNHRTKSYTASSIERELHGKTMSLLE